MLAYFPNLQTIDMTGCADVNGILKVKERYPQCDVQWMVPFQGDTISYDVHNLVLTKLAEEDMDAIPYFTELESVNARKCGDLDAIMQLFPLDQYVEKPVALMEVVPGDTCGTPAIWSDFKEILNRYEPDNCKIEMVERFAFYERSKKAYLIIASGETAIYANVLLKKGVVKV